VRIVAYLGVTGVTVLTRVMGLLLVGVGVQFLLAGIIEPLTSDQMIETIVDAVERASAR
jgi:small neutral amino acid transporter SnatA (MarC family)